MRRKWIVTVVIVMVIVLIPRHVRTLTCGEQYELDSTTAYNKVVDCDQAAVDQTPWYRPDLLTQRVTLCSLEFASDAIESSARYTKCMAIDVFFKA